jgi:hypothetical protein
LTGGSPSPIKKRETIIKHLALAVRRLAPLIYETSALIIEFLVTLTERQAGKLIDLPQWRLQIGLSDMSYIFQAGWRGRIHV